MVLFEMNYPSIWSSKAIGEGQESSYKIEKANVWRTRFDILKNGKLTGNCKYNWNGSMNIHLKDEKGKPFQLNMKYRGFWKPRFAVLLDENIHILTMHGRYRGFNVEWNVEVHHRPNVDFSIEEIIGLLGYGARCYQDTSGNY